MKEIWKDISEYNGLYQISNRGNVKSLRYNRLLKHSINNKGYCMVRLCVKKTVHTKLIHRLIAEAFIPNINNYKEVNHKNNTPKDNNIENLEWVTHRDNIVYAAKQNRMGHKERKLTKDNVLFIRENNNKLFIRELAEMFNVNIAIISLIKNNKLYKYI